MSDLATKHCQSCEGGVDPLSTAEVLKFLDLIDTNWARVSETKIQRDFKFSNYWQASAFVNAVAWIAHTEDHHPDILLTYDSVSVSWTTHAIEGLSENDFICAAKVDQLLELE